MRVTGNNEELVKIVKDIVGSGSNEISASAENKVITMLREDYPDDYCYVRVTDKCYIIVSSKGNLFGPSEKVDSGKTLSGIFNKFVEDKPERYEDSKLSDFVHSTFENVIEIM